MIQYWHVFAYKDFAGPFDNHGGDWDAEIQVQLNPTLDATENLLINLTLDAIATEP